LLDQLPLAIESCAEVKFYFRRDIGNRFPLAERGAGFGPHRKLYQRYDCSSPNTVEQFVSSLNIMALPGGQGESD